MYIVGLDLGQAKDFTALCVVERTEMPTEGPIPCLEGRYAVRYLRRWPLGSRYPSIVADVLTLLDTSPLDRITVPLVIDLTGVGRAIGDLFDQGGIPTRGVTITGGLEANTADPFNIKVPKRDLVSTLIAHFQLGRLKIADGLELTPTLLHELANFKMKVNPDTGHETFEAWRESIHDDLLLATALACWWGQTFGQQQEQVPAYSTGRDRHVRVEQRRGFRPHG